ncbi:MAG: hypothetical protein J2P57_22480 [Acidimicrobiaceae bacterium]|nr:hypothetical protein [Acidimicrobiaceae bacterium]
MSRSIDLFVASDLPLEQVAEQLGHAISASLSASPHGATFILRDGDVVAELGPHPYQDDGDLLLSRYRYALSAAVPDDARPQYTPEAVVLRKIAQAVRAKDLFPVLLVMDLQFRDGDGERDTAPAAP